MSIYLRAEGGGDLSAAAAINLQTCYPGGLYTTLTFSLRQDISAPWPVKPHEKVEAMEGFGQAWEGLVTKINPYISGSSQGLNITCTGYWGCLMEKIRWDKPWSDQRYESWLEPITRYSGADRSLAKPEPTSAVDTNNRLRFSPRGQTQLANQYTRRVYTAPTGETVKRLTFNYTVQPVALISPEIAYFNDAPGTTNTFTELVNAVDDNPDSWVVLNMTSDDYLWVGVPKDDFVYFNLLRLDIRKANTNAATLSAAYWNGGSYAALAITDGTAAGGKTLAQDGDITFVKPAGWALSTVNTFERYWLRLKPSANLSEVFMNDIYCGITQSWQLELWGNGAGAADWTQVGAGSGTADVTLATPNKEIFFLFRSTAKQTPPNNGLLYGEISGIDARTETSWINFYEIAKDLIGHVPALSADDSQIERISLDITPFISSNDKLSDIMANAAKPGSGGYEPIGYGIRGSALANDGKPILFIETVPPTSGYDYLIAADDNELGSDFSMTQDLDGVVNYVTVQYTNAAGRTVVITPTDDPTLMDSASIALYGERHGDRLTVNTTSSTIALSYARRYLAQYKDPQWQLANGISVHGYIRTVNKDNPILPASLIRAGMRVKVENWLGKINGVNPVFLITATDYNADDDTCQISVGQFNRADVYLARKLWRQQQ